MNYKNKVLVAVDGSYLLYFSIHGAVKRWQKYSLNGKFLKDPEETDQSNLPDLTIYSDFCKFLEDSLVKKLDNIESIINNAIEANDIDPDIIQKVFSLDSPIYNNWRKKIFPEYKAQRKVSPKAFNVNKIMAYAENLLRNKLNIEEHMGYSIIKIDTAEGDDILATVLQDLDDYQLKILIASDKDFLQLNGVVQFDLFGAKKEILPKLKEEAGVTLTNREYLILKILIGDGADNIPGCFDGVGEKRAIKLIKNRDLLKERLCEDQTAANQFVLNQKIISFKNIPDRLRQTILTEVKSKFKRIEEESERPEFDVSDLMQL